VADTGTGKVAATTPVGSTPVADLEGADHIDAEDGNGGQP